MNVPINLFEQSTGPMKFTWRRHGGYEVSSRGDKRFSALYAKMPDGRTIEQWYQCDIKGYDVGGTNWRAGKGLPSLIDWPNDHQWQMYLSLWRIWTIHHPDLIRDLVNKASNIGILSDMFAKTPINQANALATILNEWDIV